MQRKTYVHPWKDLINHKQTECRQFHDRSCNLVRTVEKEAACCGGVAEWLNAAVLKTVERASVPGVRIPPPPPFSQEQKDPKRLWSSRLRVTETLVPVLGFEPRLQQTQCCVLPLHQTGMATPLGLEPRTSDLEGRCSST